MKNKASIKKSLKSRFISIKGSKIHYLEGGYLSDFETTFLFLHGNPTSSYLWRNIIPHLTNSGRCIAPDLIGFGKSDKPKIEYTFQDHYTYINEFISQMGLNNIVLVLHDWGGAIGLHFAAKHPHKIKGLVIMETFYKPMEWSSLSPFAQWLFNMFQGEKLGHFLNGHLNLFIKFILPFSIVRKLTKEEKQHYEDPFRTVESRKPIIKFPQELPIKGRGTENETIASNYFTWLKTSELPKLLLYANPGVQITEEKVEELKETLSNLKVQDLGEGLHFIQEDKPNEIGLAIKNWFHGIDLKT